MTTQDKDCKITLYIDTPKPLMRPLKDFKKHNQLESLLTDGCLNMVAYTGHAFIGITDEKGKEERWGFTAAEGVPSLFKAIKGVKGSFENENDNPTFNEAIVFPITKEQYQSAQKKIDQERNTPSTYKLFEKNCASVASDILEAANVDDMPTGKLRMTPYGLTVKKRIMLAQRRYEAVAFKAKNIVNGLFGNKKTSKTELLNSLRSKPLPVPLDNGMKVARQGEMAQIDINKVLASISFSRKQK